MNEKMNQKEIGRIKLSDTQDIVVSIVENERLDIRTWINIDDYKGFTKKGVRLSLFDGNWQAFKDLMDKVDKIYQEIA